MGTIEALETAIAALNELGRRLRRLRRPSELIERAEQSARTLQFHLDARRRAQRNWDRKRREAARKALEENPSAQRAPVPKPGNPS